jgi:serine/threonine protein kinase
LAIVKSLAETAQQQGAALYYIPAKGVLVDVVGDVRPSVSNVKPTDNIKTPNPDNPDVPPEMRFAYSDKHTFKKEPSQIMSELNNAPPKYKKLFETSFQTLAGHAEAAAAAAMNQKTPAATRLLRGTGAAPKFAVWNLGVLMLLLKKNWPGQEKEEAHNKLYGAYHNIMYGCLMPHPMDRMTINDVIHCINKALESDAAVGGARRQSGGDLLGEGSYGCVFRPSVPCRDPAASAAVRPGSVSKVFAPSDAGKNSAAEEMRAFAALNELDPAQAVFYYPYLKCDVDRAAVADAANEAARPTSRRHANCSKLAEQEPDGWSAVLMPGAESDLHTYLKERRGSLTRREAVRLMLNVLVGVQMLVSRGLVHQDIKLQNIVVVRDAAGAVTTRLIDFGWLKTAVAAAAEFSPNKNYFVNPPEYRFAQGKYNGVSSEGLLQRETELLESHASRDNPKLGVVMADEKYLRSLLELAAAQPTPIDMAKSDIYSVGISLFLMYSYLVPPEMDEPVMVKFYDELVRAALMPHPAHRVNASDAVNAVNAAFASPQKQPTATAPTANLQPAAPPPSGMAGAGRRVAGRRKILSGTGLDMLPKKKAPMRKGGFSYDELSRQVASRNPAIVAAKLAELEKRAEARRAAIIRTGDDNDKRARIHNTLAASFRGGKSKQTKKK